MIANQRIVCARRTLVFPSFLVSALAAVCCSAILPSSTAFAAPRQQPNVILFLTDDQGYGDLPSHGNPILKMPHLDSFARQAIEITHFHVSPVCSPTRASLMTGRYNFRTGVCDVYGKACEMDPREVTIAAALRGAGYATGMFGKWHLGDDAARAPTHTVSTRRYVPRWRPAGGAILQSGIVPQRRERAMQGLLHGRFHRSRHRVCEEESLPAVFPLPAHQSDPRAAGGGRRFGGTLRQPGLEQQHGQDLRHAPEHRQQLRPPPRGAPRAGSGRKHPAHLYLG